MPRFPWSLSAIASKTGSSELSPEDVVHACSSAVHALEPQVRAWSWLGLDDARDRARALTAGARDEQRRPLLGVPYAAKDIFGHCRNPHGVGYGDTARAGCLRPTAT